MTAVVLLSVCAGLGVIGITAGLRRPVPRLETIWAEWHRPTASGRSAPRRSVSSDAIVPQARTHLDRIGQDLAHRLNASPWVDRPRARALRAALVVVDLDPGAFAARLVLVAGCCALAPIGIWIILAAIGEPIPLGPVVILAGIGPVVGVALSAAAVVRAARDRRRHVRVVLGSFVDLVVLSLAGGVGIDGALHAASQVTPDWAAKRIAGALAAARDGGRPPWDALGALGVELGVPELEELATTVQLAGTEGARIRQSLTARGASLRRHEQADAESAANAMTERLFLPGALLLLGFLVFIGYPAVQRILGGF